jgi:hypothetical protein
LTCKELHTFWSDPSEQSLPSGKKWPREYTDLLVFEYLAILTDEPEATVVPFTFKLPFLKIKLF